MKRDDKRETSKKLQARNESAGVLIRKIVSLFTQMNIMKLVELLDEDIDYQGIGKWRFLAITKKQFQKFINKGDTYLIQKIRKCTGCSFGSYGFVFTGNNSKRIWPLTFILKMAF